MNLEALDSYFWVINSIISAFIILDGQKYIEFSFLTILLILSILLNVTNHRPSFRQGAGNGIICGSMSAVATLAAVGSPLFDVAVVVGIVIVLIFLLTRRLIPTSDFKVVPIVSLFVLIISQQFCKWNIYYTLRVGVAISLSLLTLTILMYKAPNSFSIGEFILVSILSSLPIPFVFDSTGLKRFLSIFVTFGVIILCVALFTKNPLTIILGGLPILISYKEIPLVIKFVFQTRRILIISYCGAICLVFILISNFWNGLKKFPQIVQRKFFHLMALLVFVPPIIMEPDLLKLMICGAIFVFLFVESLRITKFPIISNIISNYVSGFIDERDSGELVLTHLYLLLGLGLPILLSDLRTPSLLIVQISGLSVLAIGDAAASIVGVNFGKHKWPGSKKSYEGTFGAFIGTFLCMFCIQQIHHIDLSFLNIFVLSVESLMASLDEAFTSQIDNLILPFSMIPWICFCSLFVHRS